MKETRILLASVLKPINDSRMFRKLGLSLAKLPQTQIQIVGYAAPKPVAPENISFYPLFRFKRLSINRFLSSWRYFKLLLQVSPAVIIIGTHELLPATLLYKIFRKCRVVYDIRENYYLNLTTQGIYSPGLSRLLANIIRLTERLTAPFIDYFFLAEKSYATELPFLKEKYLILENKYQPAAPPINNDLSSAGQKISAKEINLLYSGTISELYGVFWAINLLEALNQVAPIFRLTIIGYCPQPEVLIKLKNRIAANSSINLIGGDYLVPHADILAAIQNSHVGLLPYQPHPSTFNCVPTKLFEYLGNALPVIIQRNPLWEELIRQYEAGLNINFQNFDAPAIYATLINQIFYGHKNLNTVFWQTEEEKLLHWAQTILPI
ncbi:glycosyltransferase family protein [Adhaeribacter rhizoryzae]|uniref:Glycosyltransferase family 4 protein n=1 Tax=Adhaeribacter rhizoryzae TaxID=2607907 RepID=A0A5M6DJE1_9BACT|nr:glycosyltransferase family 4 protein [Adhaeribacter rhizoryzae]KAA5547687.1 glycosyltransferase family 4 protein [Adhaeribacter rhizoryzae]